MISITDRVMNSVTDVNGWRTTSLRWSRTWAGKTGKSGSDSAFLQRTLRSRKPANDKSLRLIGIGRFFEAVLVASRMALAADVCLDFETFTLGQCRSARCVKDPPKIAVRQTWNQGYRTRRNACTVRDNEHSKQRAEVECHYCWNPSGNRTGNPGDADYRCSGSNDLK